MAATLSTVMENTKLSNKQKKDIAEKHLAIAYRALLAIHDKAVKAGDVQTLVNAEGALQELNSDSLQELENIEGIPTATA